MHIVKRLTGDAEDMHPHILKLTVFHPSERINSADTLGDCSNNSAALAAEINAKMYTKASRMSTIVTTSEVELTTNLSINLFILQQYFRIRAPLKSFVTST